MPFAAPMWLLSYGAATTRGARGAMTNSCSPSTRRRAKRLGSGSSTSMGRRSYRVPRAGSCRSSRAPRLARWTSGSQPRDRGSAMAGDPQRAIAARARDPAALEEALEDHGTQRAGEVRAALGPVEASPGERAARRGERGEVDVERLSEPPRSRARHAVAVVGLEAEQARALPALDQLDRDDAGEVVVTGPSGAQRGVCRRGCARRRGGGRDRAERLERPGNVAAGELVVAVPAGLARDDEPAPVS